MQFLDLPLECVVLVLARVPSLTRVLVARRVCAALRDACDDVLLWRALLARHRALRVRFRALRARERRALLADGVALRVWCANAARECARTAVHASGFAFAAVALPLAPRECASRRVVRALLHARALGAPAAPRAQLVLGGGQYSTLLSDDGRRVLLVETGTGMARAHPHVCALVPCDASAADDDDLLACASSSSSDGGDEDDADEAARVLARRRRDTFDRIVRVARTLDLTVALSRSGTLYVMSERSDDLAGRADVPMHVVPRWAWAGRALADDVAVLDVAATAFNAFVLLSNGEVWCSMPRLISHQSTLNFVGSACEHCGAKIALTCGGTLTAWQRKLESHPVFAARPDEVSRIVSLHSAPVYIAAVCADNTVLVFRDGLSFTLDGARLAGASGHGSIVHVACGTSRVGVVLQSGLVMQSVGSPGKPQGELRVLSVALGVRVCMAALTSFEWGLLTEDGDVLVFPQRSAAADADAAAYDDGGSLPSPDALRAMCTPARAAALRQPDTCAAKYEALGVRVSGVFVGQHWLGVCVEPCGQA